jgi:ribonuclease R
MQEYEDAILRHVNDPKYHPVKPAVMAKKLGLEGDDIQAFKKVVKRLVKAGKLAWGPSHLVYSAAKGQAGEVPGEQESGASKHVVGTFRRAEGGFGFVRPEGTPAGAGRDADVFVPANGAGDAANGDIVRIRLSSKVGRMGKSEGRIIDIVERATNRFVGTYAVTADMGMVQIDGKIFASPVYVGDPGAKGAQPDDKVVIEMVRFPSHLRDGEGVIIEILGKRGEPGVDTLSIIREFNLPGEFSEAVFDDAREQAAIFDEGNLKNRQDLTGETIVTIDPATARDFDDAISLEQLKNGHWSLGVHIADVSHFVRAKSPLDQEAKERATSVYLPDMVIPMIPEIISNNLASLQPDRVRYAITARIEFTPEGQRVATDVFKSAIKSCRRFTYEEVDDFLADRLSWKKKLTAEVHGLLNRMHELAMILRERRMARGALELNMPELEIDLDKNGSVSGAHLEVNTESHQIIEEFMLAANEAVAEMLFEKGVVFLRRVHGAPEPRKLKSLTDFVSELGFKTESLESRFALQGLLNKAKGDSREHAINYAALRAMQRAVYSPEEEGHYALASKCYCHFTSPIRRYPDLTIHRLIEQVSQGKTPDQHLGELLALGDHCSEREQRATEAERELNRVKLLLYLQDKVGMQMDGIITGVESFGLFVMGTHLPAEGFVHITSLSDDYYKFDKAGHVISGFRSGNTYRLGDPVRVAVAAVDVERRELDLRLLEKIGGPAGGRKPKRKINPQGRPQKPRPGNKKTDGKVGRRRKKK